MNWEDYKLLVDEKVKPVFRQIYLKQFTIDNQIQEQIFENLWIIMRLVGATSWETPEQIERWLKNKQRG